MKRKRTGLSSGHDAFLDIVANLVGILIILVVIMGARSHQLASEIQADEPSQASIALIEREYGTLAAVSRDVAKLERAIAAYEGEIEVRKNERAALLAIRDAAKQQWDQAVAKADREQKRLAELERERQEAAATLTQLQSQGPSTEPISEKLIAVQHLPTPMAKTVFGDEIHFRLKDRRLAYVPIEELMAEIKEDFHRLAGSVRGGKQTSSVGPIRDFVARYNMQTSRQPVSRDGQIRIAARAHVAELLIEPLEEPIGEPMTRAFQPESTLAYELAGRDPANTTITVWVYPDSFAEFRQLKEYLYQLGFATAARPLPHGHPIAGSPSGSRSQSQ